MDKTHDALVLGLLEWQKAHPIGTQVEYTEDNGSTTTTYTRSDPWVLPSGHPVILIVGRSGCVAFERCRPVE